MVKCILILALLILAAQVCGAEQSGVIGPFGGLDDTDNSLVLPSNMSPDLLNVDFPPGGKSVRKRKGYGLFFNTAVTTAPIHGVYHFFDANGSDVDLAFNDRYMTASVGGLSPATLFSTGTANATWQCVDSLGYAYCASSVRDPVIKTNGTSYSQVPMAAVGTMLAATTQRLVTAGFNSTPAQINLSKTNDFNTWATGPLATDAYTETISAPGSRITHITYACGNLIWFKENSFGQLVNPDDSINAQNMTISPTIGTLDNSSVYYNGVLHFRAQDGNFYSFDCSTLQKMSRDIQNTIGVSATRRYNSWSVSSAWDFSFGDSSTANYSATAGGVWISTDNVNTPDNSFENNTWTVQTSTVVVIDQQKTGNFSIWNCGIINPKDGTYFLQIFNNCSSIPNIIVSVIDANSNSILSSTSLPWQEIQCGWTQYTLSGLSAYTKRAVKIQITNNRDSAKITSTPFTLSGNSITFYFQSEAGQNPQCVTRWLDFFQAGQTTKLSGTYRSAVYNAPNLTSWGTFVAQTSGNGGSQTFLVRSSTGSFTVLSATPAWVSQTNGAIVAASTGTYFQFADTFTVTYASQTPTLNSVKIDWYEGNASDKAYGVYFDDAIWWAIQKGAGATANNAVLRYELPNNWWTVYDIAANGFYRQGNALYFGSAASGSVYKFGDVDSDAGSAINSYWKSKDYFGLDPFSDNEYRKLSVSAKLVANSTMTLTYTTDGSSSTAYTIPLTSNAMGFIRNNRNLPAGRHGTYFNVKVGNNAADQPWELFGIGYTFEPRPWKVAQ